MEPSKIFGAGCLRWLQAVLLPCEGVAGVFVGEVPGENRGPSGVTGPALTL